ncbi:recombinase family protein [Massilia sp. 2TAF26]|uniref:recombinase family protein n=1 Tax=Massilia sp. 2TAF26 TaxID=3233012 RepID=UPI003F98DAA9
MYVRMSTESQDYSTDHQRAKIREYAAAHDIPIIREYVDDGKSGLDIKGRAGLSFLMRDVQSAKPDFSHIIVYDISRWGRFQDIDEAAYHEHTCRRAGIEVIYCGERFANDGGLYSSLLKSMKRVMAAEYSRDLSEKVFAAQCRFIEMGFKQGGHAGFGLRRLAIKACGTPRAILEHGESKFSATDRVVLVWGPDDEVATVRRIYSLYMEHGFSERAIVRLLNAEQVRNEWGRPWTYDMVHTILTNVKYYGALAYNRRTCKLSKPRTCNAPDKWIVNPDAFDGIVSRELFEAVQVERARRMRRYNRSELIVLLQDCHQRHGKLSAKIIAEDPALPDPDLFVRAFGSLVLAYDAAGLPRSRAYTFAGRIKLAGLRKKLLVQVEELARAAEATVERTRERYVLQLNDSVRVRVEVAVPYAPQGCSRTWRIFARPRIDFIISGRLNRETGEIIDYFLVSAADLATRPIRLRESNLERYSSMRFASLDGMFGRITADQPEEEC